MQQPLEQRPRPVEGRRAEGRPVVGQHLPHALEGAGIDQGRLLAGVDLVLVAHPADVGHVGQQAVQAGLGEGPAAARLALPGLPALVGPAAPLQLLHHRQQRLVLQVQREDGADAFGLVGVDQQPAAARVHVEAQQRPAAGPLALAPRGGDLVAGALGDDLALELGEGQQDVEDQPAHAGGRVEQLRHGHEGDLVLLEGLHEACEVEQGAAEAIDLVDDHAVDLAGLDVGHEALQGGPVHVAAGEAAVVVAVGQAAPSPVRPGCGRRPRPLRVGRPGS